MANTVRILVTAKDEVSGTFDKIRDKASVLSKTDIGKGMLQGAGIAAFGVIQGAAMGALNAVQDFATGSVSAAREEQASIAKLRQAVEANVTTHRANLDVIEDTIAAREKLAFADDEQRNSLAVLIARTKDETKALDLQRIAMDLARLKGIDLASASDVIGKVYSGNVGILTRYGIAVKKGSDATSALAQVQAAAAGQAEAFANTSEGAAKGAQIALEDLQEEIGSGLLPVLTDLSKWVRDDGVPALSALVKTLGFLGSAFGEPTREVKSFREEAERSGIFWQITGQQIAGGMDDIKFSAKDTSKALADFRAGERPLNKIADAAGAARTKISGLGDKVHDLVGGYKDLVKWADKAAQVLNPNDPEELRLEFEKNRLELLDNKDALKDLTDEFADLEKKGKKPTRDQRQHMIDLRLAVEDGEDQVISLGIQMVNTGKITFNQLEKRLENLGIDLSRLTGSARELLRYLRLIDDFDAGTLYDNGKRRGGRAAGGYIAPYSSSLVNEGVNGTEAIFSTGSSGAYVNPSAAAASAGQSGGSPVIVQVVLDRRVIAESVAPGVTAWQQGRGLMARA